MTPIPIVGDLVRCVRVEWTVKHGTTPELGEIYTVADANGNYLALENLMDVEGRPDLAIWWNRRDFRLVRTPSIDALRQVVADANCPAEVRAKLLRRLNREARRERAMRGGPDRWDERAIAMRKERYR